MAEVKLYLSYDAGLDWLMAYEFGRVDDGQPPEHWRGVSESFGYLLKTPEGPEVGFKVKDFGGFDPETGDVDAIWRGPRFDVPALGLGEASAGEIVLAAKSFLEGESTLNRRIFQAANAAHGTDAALLWRDCLEAGDPMAHYGLGYTLFELGRYRDAYRHLRAYTEIVPENAWAWCWRGRACHALGETAEARMAYAKAITLSEVSEDETDAERILARLDAGESVHFPDEQRPGVIRETVFDSASYLNGVVLNTEPVASQKQRPVVLFLTGGPLSGKTTVLERLGADRDALIPIDAVLVDPRAVRKQLPEWNDLYEARDPAAAEFVYDECCDVARQLVREAVDRRLNLIIDGVGASGEGQFASLIETFAANGYDVRVLLVDAPTDVAQSRNEQRGEREGLLVDRGTLASLHSEVSRRFEEWTDLPAKWELHRTG